MNSINRRFKSTQNADQLIDHHIYRPACEEDRVIGRLTDEIWALKSGRKIIAVNSPEVLKMVDPKELDEEEVEFCFSIIFFIPIHRRCNFVGVCNFSDDR